MKILTLLRHAKSRWGEAGLTDFERPLNARGERDARAMGREMRRLGLGFDRVLASPAARVVQTLRELAQGYGGAVATDCDERLYLASAERLLGFVRESDDAAERLLLAGHNPGLEQLALLLGRPGGTRDLVAAKYPTGALAELRLDAARWRDVAAGGGTLTRFIRPRDLGSED